MKEAKKTQITEQICKQAQLMRKGGANQTEIGKLLGINPCTVSRMEKAEFDFAKYQELLKERRARAGEKKEPEPETAPQVQEVIHKHEQSVTLVANHYMAEELRKQTELLTLISNKLAFIVDELTGTGSASSTGV